MEQTNKKIEQRRNREDERETTFASKIIEEDVYARSPRIKLITNNSLGAALGPIYLGLTFPFGTVEQPCSFSSNQRMREVSRRGH